MADKWTALGLRGFSFDLRWIGKDMKGRLFFDG